MPIRDQKSANLYGQKTNVYTITNKFEFLVQVYSNSIKLNTFS